MVYEYDGSYEGFLCCIFESYVNREFPIAFACNEEFPVLSLYSVRSVETDLAHSSRILRSITERSPRAARLLYRAFHTCMDNREACLYRFVQKLYADGPQFLRRPSDDACFPLYKAVRHLSGELEKLRGFVRFSDYSGVLGAEIRPKNRVLPFLRRYFCERYANESFFLYDRTHGELLLYSGGRSRIVQADSLTLAPPDEQEAQRREIGTEELENKLKEALHLLEAFKSKECAEIVNDLCTCKVPEKIEELLEQVQTKLKLYEDDEAENLLREAVSAMDKMGGD